MRQMTAQPLKQLEKKKKRTITKKTLNARNVEKNRHCSNECDEEQKEEQMVKISNKNGGE